MRRKIVLICTACVLAACAQAQTWHELEKAVGGLSAHQVHTKALLISRMKTSSPYRSAQARLWARYASTPCLTG